MKKNNTVSASKMFLQKGFYKAPKRPYQFNQFLRIFLSCNNFQAYECKGEMICLEMLANDNSLPIEKWQSE